MENPAPAVFLYGAPEDYANYRAALTSAGLRPVVSRSLAAALGCEALLLPGGGDIHGSLPPEESFLLHAFWDAHRPILGICMTASPVISSPPAICSTPPAPKAHWRRCWAPAPPSTAITTRLWPAWATGSACASGAPTASPRVCTPHSIRFWASSGIRSISGRKMQLLNGFLRSS